MLDRPDARWAMPVGSSTAWSTVLIRTVWSRQRPPVPGATTTASAPSSQRPGLESTSRGKKRFIRYLQQCKWYFFLNWVNLNYIMIKTDKSFKKIWKNLRSNCQSFFNSPFGIKKWLGTHKIDLFYFNVGRSRSSILAKAWVEILSHILLFRKLDSYLIFIKSKLRSRDEMRLDRAKH